MNPGDQLKICPGNYTENLFFNRDGTAKEPGKAEGSNYIFITASDKNSIPIFKGTVTLTGDYNHISYIAVHPSGASGTGLWKISGSSYSVLQNIIKKDDGFQHAKGEITGLLIDGGPSHSDFYNNNVSDWGDDAIETEGGNVCVRIYNNLFHEGSRRMNGYSVFAIAANYIGPLYIFNNISNLYDEDVDDLFKTGNANDDATGQLYIMNNTLFGGIAGITNPSGGVGQQNIYAYNNTWKIKREFLRLNDSFRDGDDIDYNNYDIDSAFEWEYDGEIHRTFSAWVDSTDHDRNGISVSSELDAEVKTFLRDQFSIQSASYYFDAVTLPGVVINT